MEQQTKQKEKLFFGWLVVLGGSLMMGTGIGLFVNCNGVFLRPVTESLGFTHGQFLLYPTIASTLGMLTSVVYGQFYQKMRIKPFMWLGAVVCSASVIGYSFCTELWQFYLFATLYGFCSTPILTMTVAILVNNWFLDKKSLATGLAFCGSGFTAAVMMPIVTIVVEKSGWQWGYRTLGVTGFVLMVFALLFLIREKPEDMGLQKYGAEKVAAQISGAARAELPGITRRQAVKEPAFYIMILGFFTLMLVGMGISPNVISYLKNLGYSGTLAALVSSTYLAVMVGGKVILGALFDRLGATASAMLTGCCMVASVISLFFAGAAPFMPFVFAVCFGFGYATLSVPIPYITGENFGMREFALIYSLVTMLGGLGGSIGMPLTGLLYDATQSYTTVWTLYLGIAILSTALMTLSTVLSRKKSFNAGAYRPSKRTELRSSTQAGN